MEKKQQVKKMALRDTTGDKIFYTINAIFLAILALIVLYPLYFIVIAAISDPDAVLAGDVVLYPVRITMEGFAKIMERKDVWLGYRNTILYTVLTVILSIIVTVPAGWALSRKTLPGQKAFMIYFIIPMFFGGGLIPFYNVMSSLGLVNTIWSIVLPAILSVWNLFMTKTFFQSSIPDTLIEAATIDGAGMFRIFWHIVMPNVKPAWLTMIIFSVQGLWNNTASTVIYSEAKKTLVYAMNQIQAGGIARTGQMAAAQVIIVAVPILIFIFSQSRILETMASSGIKD